MSLNAPAVGELTTVGDVQAIFKEWLALWFDGNDHAVSAGGQVVNFPVADIEFDQSITPQPQGTGDASTRQTVEIRLVIIPRSETLMPSSTILGSGYLATDQVLFQFMVVAKANTSSADTQLLGRQVGDLLKAILANPDSRYALAEKGIFNLEPKPPVPITDNNYARYLLGCAGKTEYVINFSVPDNQTTPVPIPTGPDYPLPFVRETPLVPGEYLVGTYPLTIAVTATYAQVTAWAPQTTPTVLELEVGGLLTGITLTLAVGTALTDVSDSETFSLLIAAAQTIRWKIVSGPADAASMAWHASVLMEVTPQA